MNNWQKFKDNQEVWDQITLSFRGNYRQLFLWGERQAKQGWKVDRYIYKKEGEVVSSVQIFSKSFLFFKFFYIPGGVSGNCYGFGNIRGLIKSLASLSVYYVKLDSNYQNNQKAVNYFKKNKWHRPFYFLNSAKTLFIDMSTEQNISSSQFSGNWKRNLKKFEKNKATISISNKISSADIRLATNEMQKFKNIYLRDNPNNISEIIQIFGKDILIVYCLDSDKNILGFRSALIIEDRAWDFYAATTPLGRSLSAGFALLNTLINECQNRGVKRFILPLSRSNHGDTLFKKGTGGVLHELVGEWEYSNIIFFRGLINYILFLMFNSSLVAFLKRFISR